MWCSGYPSSHTSHKEGGLIQSGRHLHLSAYPGPGVDTTIQIPEGQQEVRYHSQGATTPWSRHGMLGLTSPLPKGWQEGQYRSRPLSMPVPEAQMGVIQPESPQILKNETEEELQDGESEEEPMVESDNSDTSLAALSFIASTAQLRIGTEKELEGD